MLTKHHDILKILSNKKIVFITLILSWMYYEYNIWHEYMYNVMFHCKLHFPGSFDNLINFSINTLMLCTVVRGLLYVSLAKRSMHIVSALFLAWQQKYPDEE